MNKIIIRKATSSDADKVWEIFRLVIATGDTYVFPPDMSKKEALSHWFGPKYHTYVAEHKNEIKGTYIIKENQMGLGSHIANGSYMIHPESQGLGIGRKLGEHSIQEAQKLGFKAMQFNFVVSSNERAVALWMKLGFEIIGTIPDAFQHQTKGLVAAYIMYRKL